jgi:hypothetical protein
LFHARAAQQLQLYRRFPLFSPFVREFRSSECQSLPPPDRCRIDRVSPRDVGLCLAGSKPGERHSSAAIRGQKIANMPPIQMTAPKVHGDSDASHGRVPRVRLGHDGDALLIVAQPRPVTRGGSVSPSNVILTYLLIATLLVMLGIVIVLALSS